MNAFIRVCLVLIVLLLLTNNMGNLRHESNNLLIILLTGGFLFLFRPFHLVRKIWWGILLTALSVAIVALLPGLSLFPRLMGVSLLLFFLDITLRTTGRREKELPPLLLTSVLFSLYWLAYLYLPQLWQLEQAGAYLLSTVAGMALRRDLLLGANAAGVHILVLFAIYCLSLFLFSKRHTVRRFLIVLPILVIAEMAYILVHFPISHVAHEWFKFKAFHHIHAQFIYFILAATATYLYHKRTELREVPIRHPDLPSIVGLVLLLASICLVAWPTSLKKAGGSVLLFDKGYLNWRTPVFGNYGDKSGGMFGILPQYLEMTGYEVERGLITEETLAGANTLVIINLMERFSPGEMALIWDFVHGGGSLLAMGDHTGVKGIRDPFNKLLEPVGIELNFDCAQNIRRGWIDTMEFFKHPSNLGIQDESQVQVWIGASLDVAFPSRPVILGRYAFSDLGNLFNTTGAYLGDRRYNPGELLGDVILVAEANYGEGKVLVFGDTSSFQNGAMVKSHDFIDRVFWWLTSREEGNFFHQNRRWISLALLIGAVISFLFSRLNLPTMAIPCLFLLVSPAADLLNQRGWDGPRIQTGDVAHIDRSHGQWFDLMSWQDNSVGGFEYNLMRNGFYPLMLPYFSPSRLPESRILVIFSPLRPFSKGEMEAIDNFLVDGGLAIISVGWESRDPSVSLLRHFDLDISNIPLGPVETTAYGQNIRFHNAYPIEADTTQVEVIARGWDYPVMAYREVGEGGVFLVSDGSYFFNQNLEGRENHHLGNIFFIRELLSRKVKHESEEGPGIGS